MAACGAATTKSSTIRSSPRRRRVEAVSRAARDRRRPAPGAAAARSAAARAGPAAAATGSAARAFDASAASPRARGRSRGPTSASLPQAPRAGPSRPRSAVWFCSRRTYGDEGITFAASARSLDGRSNATDAILTSFPWRTKDRRARRGCFFEDRSTRAARVSFLVRSSTENPRGRGGRGAAVALAPSGSARSRPPGAAAAAASASVSSPTPAAARYSGVSSREYVPSAFLVRPGPGANLRRLVSTDDPRRRARAGAEELHPVATPLVAGPTPGRPAPPRAAPASAPRRDDSPARKLSRPRRRRDSSERDVHAARDDTSVAAQRRAHHSAAKAAQ